ncbi:M43 family zinc metalloprotease [Thalassomonas actiniarum]|uniref:PKD domain-containing protein n=1 Tax=Thalassomonas actiniarum TaxID=485447 RepID=A0AAE9YPK4_9GAMM|nr:M43 family zinc metalloprotease [Thalassomonas actiniarum]WDD97196.1 PKD domain-containing protein [Thalassomonas actiniarum]
MSNKIISGLSLSLLCCSAWAGASLKTTPLPADLAFLNQTINNQTTNTNKASGQICGTDNNNQSWQQIQRENRRFLADSKSSSNEILNQLQQTQVAATENSQAVDGRYYVPVVFHIYGRQFNCDNGGDCLTDEKIIDALNKTNEDFLGLNTQDGPIAAEFQAIRENLNIEFVLAQKDPSGQASTGIVRYNREQKGYGNGSSHNSEIAADAWDNFKYMNVYIMNDLYDDGSTNNSGVAWYPQVSMSESNTARVVYNGAYLGTNTNENFRSVLTHEFGHFLNLPHTFEDGCSVHQAGFCEVTGDRACDTPQMGSSDMADNHLNCMGQPTNTENFMHYTDNYAMFTAEQTKRMTAALHGPARASLWSNSNLIATGLSQYTSDADHPWDGSGTDLIPSGSAIVDISGISANKGEVETFTADIPSGTQAVAFYLDNFGDKDPDLYVSKGSEPQKNGDTWVADHISFKSPGTAELITLSSPSASDTYYAAVDAYSEYSNARLRVLGTTDPSLCDTCRREFLHDEQNLQSAKGATPKEYQFNVPNNASKTLVVIPGGYSGDPDIYVRKGQKPTNDNYDCRPFSAPKMAEYCEISGGGTVHVMIDPFLEYSEVNLQVYYETNDQAGQSPIAQANGDYSGVQEQAVSFSSAGSNDPDGNIVSYHWQFGDGMSSNDADPVHTYTSSGEFTATLTVTDNDGLEATDSATVTISGQSLPLESVCETQAAITGGRLTSGKAECLGTSQNIWLSLGDVSGHQSLAVTIAHGQGNLDLYYRHGGWPSGSSYDASSENAGNSECIYIADLSQISSYWGYFQVKNSTGGATMLAEFDTDGCRR